LISIGAKGVVSVLSNLLPAEVKRMTKLALEGNFADAVAIHHRYFRLSKPSSSTAIPLASNAP